MTDLLGDPTPETPPMSAPLPWAVFAVTENEWYVARTLDEAKQRAADDLGMTVAECEADDLFEDAHELDAAAMEKYTLEKYTLVDEEAPERTTTTFREELVKRVAAGIAAPGLFAADD